MLSARQLPTTDRDPAHGDRTWGPGANSVLFEGLRIPFFLEPGKGWRIRSRSVRFPVDYSTGIFDRAKAKRAALAFLEEKRAGGTRLTARSLEDLVACYLALPRRTADRTALYNITQLRAVCRVALRKELKSVRVHEVRPELWQRYMAARLGGRLDFSARNALNVTLNTAVRAAASIFKQTLRAAYARAGFEIPADATTIEWLQELRRPRRDFDESGWLRAWEALPWGPLKMALGLARWAGLRRNEIQGCRAHWLEHHRGRWGIVVCDRPEEGFFCKTGEPRFSVLLSGPIIEKLQAIPPDDWAVDLPGTRSRWFARVPQQWLREWIGGRDVAMKPLHKLRAWYLDEVMASAERRLQEEALAEAAAAGGHTSTRTTRQHYLKTEV